LGIGTSSPYTLLELSSTDPILRFNDSNGGTDTKNFELRYVGTNSPDIDGLYFRTVNDANTVYSDKMVILGSGNVGIGTSPSYTLDVSAANAVGMIRTPDTTPPTLGLFVNSGSNGVGTISVDNGGHMTFDTGSSGAGQAERMRIDSSGNVGFGGVTSPQAGFGVSGCIDTNGAYFARGQIAAHQTNAAVLQYGANLTELRSYGATAGSGQIRFLTGGGGGSADSEAMRIDASGNLLVGTTDNNPANDTSGTGGIALGAASYISVGRANDPSLFANRIGSDGDITSFFKDGSNVGSIQATAGDLAIGTGDTGLRFNDGGNSIIPHNISTNNPVDNALDLGQSGYRFDDIFATNGTIQTSDRNEKQDIAELSDAEQRVAVAAKGLLRKFRWKDKVAEKGDEARTHFGIIAQDLQAAFAAEGLDAGDYAMFISSTWTDEETGEERTRMGVRYSELLAFIIGAL
jgi:hypothetical protein